MRPNKKTTRLIRQLKKKLFNRKKSPKSENYPFVNVAAFEVLGENSGYEDFYLVGKNWKEGKEKPIALFYGCNDWKLGFTSDYFAQYRTVFIPRNIRGWIKLSIKLWQIKKLPEKIIVWSYTENNAIRRFSASKNIPLLRMEDGFVRSSLLGASHSTPYSLVVDSKELYFNCSEETDLENILNFYDFKSDKSLIDKSKECMRLILENRLSKYNPPESHLTESTDIKTRRKVVAIIGQVHNDASIRFGNPDNWSFEDIVSLARSENPGAEILYRPHPEVYQGFSRNKLKKARISNIAKIVTPEKPFTEFIENVDHVYTISSLSGFEALIRGIKVTTLGAPFYSGWGLTDDRVKIDRRKSKLSIEELFAGAYLIYPIYLADLNDNYVGLKSACFRIKAELHISKNDIIRKHCSKEAFSDMDIPSSHNIQVLFQFTEEALTALKQTGALELQYRALFKRKSPKSYKAIMASYICGNLPSNSERDYFLEVIRESLDMKLFNYILIDLHGVHPGDYIARQTSFLLSHNNETDTASKHIRNHIQRASSEAVLIEKSNDQDRKIYDNGLLEIEETIEEDAEETASDNLRLERLYVTLFEQAVENKNYDESINLACKLNILGMGDFSFLMQIAEICKLKFDLESSRRLYEICSRIGLRQENKKALSNFVELIPITDYKFDKEDFITNLVCVLTLKPESFYSIVQLLKLAKDKYLEQEYQHYVKLLHGVMLLDHEFSVKKIIGLLELGKPNSALFVIEEMINNGENSKIIVVTYSKVLSSLGLYNDAYKLVNKALSRTMDQTLLREYIRICAIIGNFEEAHRAYEKALDINIDIADDVILPIYLGLGRIKEGYDCYLDNKFRKEMSKYFPEQFCWDIPDQGIKSLLIIAVYGPGDELRFASLYSEIAAYYKDTKLLFTCDERLFSILERAYPALSFLPVKRVRNFSLDAPASLYDKIPCSKLCNILDNKSYRVVSEQESIMLATDFISTLRKTKDDFPGKPFLKADRDLSAAFKERLPKDTVLVGLSWRSSLTNNSRTVHYLDIEELSPIFELPNVTYVNVQYDDCDEELEWINKHYLGKVINFKEVDLFNDFEAASALMTALDYIIAPCTSVAELAGSLGLQTFFLSNSAEIKWRKRSESTSDLWFSSLIHVEASTPGDKKSLVTNLVTLLKQL